MSRLEVSFAGPSGMKHSGVQAETLYEAAILGVARLRADGWSDQIAPGTPLDVRVSEPATTHTLTLAQLRRWTDGVAASRDETLKKAG